MKIVQNKHGKVIVLRLEGELSRRATLTLKEELKSLLGNGTTRIVLVMSQLTYIDSSGVSVLIGAHNNLQAAGGGLKLVEISSAVLTVLESTRLDNFFEVWDSLDEALMVFGEPVAD